MRPGDPSTFRIRRLWVVGGCLGALAAAAAVVRAGLRVTPRPLPPTVLTASEPDTVPLPADLPAPVERFYRELYGGRVPVVDTAVVSGRGTMRISGVTMPVRFRFTHRAGRAYRHHIETTFFGARLLEVDESYIDGTARLELPFGVSEGDRIDQGANLALWAEAVWMPSLWVTDPAASWQPLADHTALLIVPFGDGSQELTARFDPATGLLASLESLRFKGEDADAPTPWINEVGRWGHVDGRPVPRVASITWADEGSPWAVLRTEEVLYGVDLPDDLGGPGP